MSIEVLMPALSPTMEEGTLAKWHVKAGDKVVSGDVIAEIETDKATMEVEAVDEGVVEAILVPEGHRGGQGQRPDRAPDRRGRERAAHRRSLSARKKAPSRREALRLMASAELQKPNLNLSRSRPRRRPAAKVRFPEPPPAPRSEARVAAPISRTSDRRRPSWSS